MTIAALEQAITFLSRTDLIANARQQALPSGVTELLKISSGDNETLLAAQESSRRSQEDVRHAAEFYVQQILFAPESNHYRVLGVDPDDAEAKIKLHYRLLVRWLHPDKNSGDWEAVFSERVNRAWQALRTAERRREYDEQLALQMPQDMQMMPSRELKPTQWRESNSGARFMSARTIKRLPIAVFSLLGIGAMLALLLFSQMQPKLRTPIQAAENQSSPENFPAPAVDSALPPVATVEQSVTQKQDNGFIASVNNDPAREIEIAAPVAATATAVQVLPVISKTKASPSALDVKEPAAVLAMQNKQKISEKPVLTSVPIMAAAAPELKTKNKRLRRNKNGTYSNETSVAVETSASASNMAMLKAAETAADAMSDASVKQFLQQFSRVYAEGDYFALHNLFTKDLSILGAPPQRTALRSYRQLFESSQRREISLDHVTWLSTDQHIVVIASYQAEVLPRGKAEAQSSRGDIRLDLRLENGQLRIIRLQSDTKNG
jgi:curved DNA-binding protein CbpA